MEPSRLTPEEREILHKTRFLNGMIGLASWLHEHFPKVPFNEASALIARFKYAIVNPEYEVRLDDLAHIPYEDIIKLRDFFEWAMELRPEQKVWYKIITDDGKKQLKQMVLSKVHVEVITKGHPEYDQTLKQYGSRIKNNTTPPARYNDGPEMDYF